MSSSAVSSLNQKLSPYGFISYLSEMDDNYVFTGLSVFNAVANQAGVNTGIDVRVLSIDWLETDNTTFWGIHNKLNTAVNSYFAESGVELNRLGGVHRTGNGHSENFTVNLDGRTVFYIRVNSGNRLSNPYVDGKDVSEYECEGVRFRGESIPRLFARSYFHLSIGDAVLEHMCMLYILSRLGGHTLSSFTDQLRKSGVDCGDFAYFFKSMGSAVKEKDLTLSKWTTLLSSYGLRNIYKEVVEFCDPIRGRKASNVEGIWDVNMFSRTHAGVWLNRGGKVY